MTTGTLGTRYAEVSAKVTALNPRATLIAVSKKQPLEAIEALYRLGHRDFGENYAQELVEKAEALSTRGFQGIRWHFIGHLQTNKTKLILPYVWAIHSVDSERLAVELGKRVEITAPPLAVFIEVNINGQGSKGGILPQELPALLQAVRAQSMLKLEGLMAIPDPDRPEPAQAFRDLKALKEKYRVGTCLSMGMTADYELALREGATHVRVGTAIFGARS